MKTKLDPSTGTAQEKEASSFRSILQLRVSRFPGAYFLHDNVLLRALDAYSKDYGGWWKPLKPMADIGDKDRLNS